MVFCKRDHDDEITARTCSWKDADKVEERNGSATVCGVTS